MSRPHILSATALLALLPSLPAAASLSCPAGTLPLVQVVLLSESREQIGPPPTASRLGYLICGGGLVIQGRLANPPEAAFPFVLTLGRGTAAPGAMADLRDALVAGRVGFARDCRLPPPADQDFDVRLTWFGRPPRRNTFRLSTTADLPACASGILALSNALGQVLNSAAQAPDAESLTLQ
jgi:hypothetical protein